MRINSAGGNPGNEMVSALKSVKAEAKKEKKDEKGIGVPAGVTLSVKELGAKVKKLQQEIKRIEQGNLPDFEKERLLKTKRGELGRLNRQLKGKGKSMVGNPLLPKRSNLKKKEINLPGDASSEKMKRELVQLKEKLKKTEADSSNSIESIAKTKRRIRILETRLGKQKKV